MSPSTVTRDGATNGRRAGTTSKLRRLAAAAARLEEHRERLHALRAQTEALARTDVVVVDGELMVISELEAMLTSARATLASLQDAHGGNGDALEQLEELVAPTSWDVLDELDQLVRNRESLVERAYAEVRKDLQQWLSARAAIEPINGELVWRHAVIPNDLRAGRERLLSLVRRAEADLEQQRFLDAWQALRELESTETRIATPGRDEVTPVAASLVDARLRELRDQTPDVSGRVQLTVLRGPLDRVGPNDRGRFEYTLMLLAPGGERHVAINLQDTTTIVVQDRKYFLEIVDKVGGGAYRSLRDSRPADAAPGVEGRATAALDELRAMGKMLYKLLLPDRMKDVLREHPSAALSITTNDLELPWELMFDDAHPPGVGSFLALQRPITRMPVGRSRGRRTRQPEGTSTRRRVALIASVGTPELPAAKSEVMKIKDGLEQQWGSRVEVDVFASGEKDREPTGARFRQVLLDPGYEIVHYAGHAAFDAERPDQSGLMLDEGEVCFAQKIQRLLQGNPLVFLNACETARLQVSEERPPPEGIYEGDPRDGLASAFVYGGALACIGTLWPVSDDVASDFAVAFYNKALEGHPLGVAMLEARKATFGKYEQDASPGAFVLYGDPSFQLTSPNPLLTPSG